MQKHTRKIPATMATQHPDHAQVPYWHSEAFISTQHEAKETFLSFSELGITEYKWDWEGKLVDESVLERLFGQYFDFFKQHPLGQEKFLTFRLPNPKVETEFRVGRAFMNLASAASVAKHFGLPTPPLFEVILPMTETAQEILDIQEAYDQMHRLTHPMYRLEQLLTNLRVIPLFEQVATIIRSDEILKDYLQMYQKRFHKLPPYMRPYVARSDPALNSGIVPTVLAIKIALAKYKKLEETLGIPMYPVIGAAALPFRGGISPLTVKKFADEYKGIRTTTIQSAFRYDFEKQDVIDAISFLEKTLPGQQTEKIPEIEQKELAEIIPVFETSYREAIQGIAPLVNDIAKHLPKRRERVQHVGLFGYSRGVGKVKLPRAISFTASLYSIGVPPEFIGTGRALKHVQKTGKLDLIKKYYIYLQSDLEQAGKYLNKATLQQLAKKSPSWKKILEDVHAIEEIFAIELGPQSKKEKNYHELTKQVFEKLQNGLPIENFIEQAAILRKSLG